MDVGQPCFLVTDIVDCPQPFEQVAQLGLTVVREEEVVERLEAAALIGLGDAVAAPDGVVEEGALGACPARDLLA